jgi:hypothetical protein
MTLASARAARVVANHEEFVHLVRSNEALAPLLYRIELTTHTVIRYRAGGTMGIYTVRDTGGAKAVFDIRSHRKARPRSEVPARWAAHVAAGCGRPGDRRTARAPGDQRRSGSHPTDDCHVVAKL